VFFRANGTAYGGRKNHRRWIAEDRPDRLGAIEVPVLRTQQQISKRGRSTALVGNAVAATLDSVNRRRDFGSRQTLRGATAPALLLRALKGTVSVAQMLDAKGCGGNSSASGHGSAIVAQQPERACLSGSQFLPANTSRDLRCRHHGPIGSLVAKTKNNTKAPPCTAVPVGDRARQE